MSQRPTGLIALTALMFSTLSTFSRPARADFYSDAKDVIEQVIEDELATQAIPNAAQKIPVLCEFFPSTIYTLEKERYSGIVPVLRKEVADAIGFLVLTKTHVNGPRVAGQGSASMTAASLQELPPPSDTGVDLQSTQLVAVQGLRRAATHGVAKATTFTPNGAVTIKDAKTCTITDTSISIATTALSHCIASQANPNRETRCAASLLVRDAVNGDVSMLSGDLRRLAIDILVQFISIKLPTTGGAAITTQTIASATTDLFEGLAQGKDSSSISATFCNALLPGRDANDPLLTTCNAAVIDSLAIVQSSNVNIGTLEQALSLADTIAKTCLSASRALVTGTGSNGPASASGAVMAAGAGENVCDVVHDLASGGEDIINDIETDNYGHAAGDIVDVSQNIICAKDAKACSGIDESVFAFVKALTVLTVDSIVSGIPPSSDDADFKAAAISLMEQASGPGVTRRLLTHQVEFLYFPSFTLRESWLPGHIGPTASALSAYASLELLRWEPGYTGNIVHVGGAISLIDGLGPFSEIATKNSALSTPASVFALGFIVPRAEFELAIPNISRNLVVGVGTAMRLYRAENVQSVTSAQVQYCVVGNSNCDSTGNGITWRNFEVSLFVRYVP